jgi:hypothetical protein
VEEELICCESGLLLSSTDDTSTGSTTDSEKDTPGPDWWVGECVGAALCDGSLFPDYWDGHLFCPANHGCY